MPKIPAPKRWATGVYVIRNKLNGKIYVGSSAKCILRRWIDHKKSLRRGTHHSKHLQRAWDKYGEEAFEFKVWAECSVEKCISLEQYWIGELRAADKKYGYNVCPNAGSRFGAKQAPHTEEHKQYMRDLWRSERYRKLLEEAHRRWWEDPANREEVSKQMLETWQREGYREMQSRQHKKYFEENPEAKKATSKALVENCRKFLATPEGREQRRKQANRNWATLARLRVGESVRKLRSSPKFWAAQMAKRRAKKTEEDGK